MALRKRLIYVHEGKEDSKAKRHVVDLGEEASLMDERVQYSKPVPGAASRQLGAAHTGWQHSSLSSHSPPWKHAPGLWLTRW